MPSVYFYLYHKMLSLAPVPGYIWADLQLPFADFICSLIYYNCISLYISRIINVRVINEDNHNLCVPPILVHELQKERERERAQLKRTGTLYMVRFYNNDAWQ